MSNAFKCDVCLKLYDGDVDHDIESEIAWKRQTFYFHFGFKNEDSRSEGFRCRRIAYKDICGECKTAFHSKATAAIIEVLKERIPKD